MQKFILIITSIVFLLSSCDSDGMNDEPRYLTISYHSEGHTAGEVPVDNNKYEIIDTGRGPFETHFAPTHTTDIIMIHGQGTLEKEGYRFEGWKMFQSGKPELAGTGLVDIPVYLHSPDLIEWGFSFVDILNFVDVTDINIELHAVWVPQWGNSY
jgi:hypothetical protein